MEQWLLYALSAFFLYGFWGFFPKLAVRYIDPGSALVFETGGALLVGLFALWSMGFKVQSEPRGVIFAVLTGIAGMVGTLFFFHAVREGRISVVVSITALYPLLSILLAVCLVGEQVSSRQIAGMACALLAIWLLGG